MFTLFSKRKNIFYAKNYKKTQQLKTHEEMLCCVLWNSFRVSRSGFSSLSIFGLVTVTFYDRLALCGSSFGQIDAPSCSSRSLLTVVKHCVCLRGNILIIKFMLLFFLSRGLSDFCCAFLGALISFSWKLSKRRLFFSSRRLRAWIMWNFLNVLH